MLRPVNSSQRLLKNVQRLSVPAIQIITGAASAMVRKRVSLSFSARAVATSLRWAACTSLALPQMRVPRMRTSANVSSAAPPSTPNQPALYPSSCSQPNSVGTTSTAGTSRRANTPPPESLRQQRHQAGVGPRAKSPNAQNEQRRCRVSRHPLVRKQ